LDDRRHFYFAIIIWNIVSMELASWDRKACGYFLCTFIVNTISRMAHLFLSLTFDNGNRQ
jgi:hypothetical protein